ncbi:hypothetical protein HYX01_00680 [Candidatus Woesearchaeota archaeon]|nr:hypothetical protein [Candidatus Woesearchaeota archaeon]
MEKFHELKDAAIKKLQIADHILTMTYPLVKDQRLLVSVLENLFLAFSYGMSSVLHYELFFKRVAPFPDNFASKFELFKNCAAKYKFGNEHLRIMQEIKEIVLAHKKSPMTFSRNEDFVICNENYGLKRISANMLKEYINNAKLFIKNISTILE